jgi:hypothetical protein
MSAAIGAAPAVCDICGVAPCETLGFCEVSRRAERARAKCEPPRPLMRELPRADPFPVDALGPMLAPAAQSIPELTPCSTDNAYDRAILIADALIPILTAGLVQRLHGDMSAARAARAQFIVQLRDEIADIKQETINEIASGD